jgi:hypothetical protein
MTRLSGQYSLCYDSLTALWEPSVPVEDRTAQPSTHQIETLKSQKAVQIKLYMIRERIEKAFVDLNAFFWDS